jgi:endonuclease/exonuclease/phosphatase (EEP) superfamily protein YafD
VALDLFPEFQATSQLAAVAACGIPYLEVPVAGLCGAMALASESRGGKAFWSAAFGAVVVAGHRRRSGTPAPDEPAPQDRSLTVMSANVLFGRADPQEIADLAGAADLVGIQENTPLFDEALLAVLGAEFPYRVGTSNEDGGGTMLWSRTPLTLVGNGETRFTSVVATTTVRGVEWTVATAHPAPPQMGVTLWESDAGKVLELVRPHLGDRLVLVGDFNAIEEHLTMRRLTDAGLRNAMAGAGSPGAAAWQPSWPALRAWVPPLIRIDHALHSGAVQAWRPRYTKVGGSDHKALVATFRDR